MKSTKINKIPTSPCNGSISVEARRQWLEFVKYVNDGLARPYTPSAIGNRIFEIGAMTVANPDHAKGWRDWVRKQLLSVQTQHRNLIAPEDLTPEEDSAIRKYCASAELSANSQALLDQYEQSSKNKEKPRKQKETP